MAHDRYSRQTLLLGETGQNRLSSARVCVIGAGGLGSAVIFYLCGAGVQHITVIDPDIVEESNLHRQIIHDTSTLGSPYVSLMQDNVLTCE